MSLLWGWSHPRQYPPPCKDPHGEEAVDADRQKIGEPEVSSARPPERSGPISMAFPARLLEGLGAADES